MQTPGTAQSAVRYLGYCVHVERGSHHALCYSHSSQVYHAMLTFMSREPF